MKTFYKLKSVLTFALLLIGTMAFAQEVKVSMQGVLKNFDGTIVSNGNYNIVVNLYDVTTGGTSIWSENQSITTVGGVFNSYLGATPTGLSDLQLLTFNVPYYVGITIVGDQEMSPRMELTGLPYAIRANTANFANGVMLPGNPTVTSDENTGDLLLGGGGTGDVVITQGDFITPNNISANDISANDVQINTVTANSVDDANLVGTVIAFFGTPANVPAGYLLCDGASVVRADYTRLFNVIGTASGAVDVLSFNVPDLRGMFLRGVDGATAIDPDAGTRTAANVGGNIGDAVGSSQADEFKSHNHDPQGTGGTVNTSHPSGGGYYAPFVNGTNPNRGGAETRPKNIYCYYIIKY